MTTATTLSVGTTGALVQTLSVGGALTTAGAFTTGAITFPTAHGSSNQVLKTSGSGTLQWTDQSSSSGTILSRSNSLSFDGTDDFVSVAHDSDHDLGSESAITLEAWIYPTNNQWHNILVKGNYGYGFALTGTVSAANYQVAFWDIISGSGCTKSNALAYNLHTWSHIAVTVSDSGSELTLNYYVNGENVGTASPGTSGYLGINDGGAGKSLYIGRQGSTCACNYVAGQMTDVRLWKTVLTQSQIKEWMYKEANSSHPARTGTDYLVGNWTMNQNSGSTLTDSGPNSLNGTLSGATWSSNVPNAGGTLLVDHITAVANATILGNLVIDDTTTIKQTLSVGGAITTATTLSVGTTGALVQTLSIGGALTTATTLSVGTTAAVVQTLSIGGAAELTGAVHVESTLSVTHATTLNNRLTQV